MRNDRLQTINRQIEDLERARLQNGELTVDQQRQLEDLRQKRRWIDDPDAQARAQQQASQSQPAGSSASASGGSSSTSGALSVHIPTTLPELPEASSRNGLILLAALIVLLALLPALSLKAGK